MNENLAKLEQLLSLVDTKSTMDEFVEAFSMATEYLAKNQDKLVGDVETVLARLDEMAKQIDSDNKNDLSKMRGLVADAIMNLQISLETQVSRRLSELKDGRNGKDGRDGRDGRDGTDGVNGQDGSQDTPDQVIEKINSSSLLIKKERIEGLLDIISRSISNGVAVTTNFFNGRRAKNLTIVGTGNTTVTSQQTGDLVTVTVNSTGGGGGSGYQAATGTVDGSNTVFTFSTAPSAIVVDGGRTIQKVSSDGTVNWTGTTTVTLSVAPNFDIFAVA